MNSLIFITLLPMPKAIAFCFIFLSSVIKKSTLPTYSSFKMISSIWSLNVLFKGFVIAFNLESIILQFSKTL